MSETDNAQLKLDLAAFQVQMSDLTTALQVLNTANEELRAGVNAATYTKMHTVLAELSGDLTSERTAAEAAVAAIQAQLAADVPPPAPTPAPTPTPTPTGWQAGNFLARLGIYSGEANGDYQPPSTVKGLLGGSTPPVWSTYPWGCTGAINQSSGQNGIASSCTDAISIGAKLMIGFPMSGGVDNCTVTYEEVLAGDRDADAKYFAGTLAANGCGGAMVRMGWEGNQSSSMGTPANYALAVQRLVPIMKAVAPDLQIVWNPTMDSGELATNLETYYPGDAVIDGICLDFYDVYFYKSAGGPGANGSAYPGIAITWPYYLTFPAQGGTNNGTSLDWLISFGTAHNKWVGFCECGLGWDDTYRVGGGDNPGFFDDLAEWTIANASLVKVITLWDSGGQGFSSNNGDNVNSLAAIVSHLNDLP